MQHKVSIGLAHKVDTRMSEIHLVNLRNKEGGNGKGRGGEGGDVFRNYLCTAEEKKGTKI